MPCLAELNDWLLKDRNDDWTMEEIEAALLPADPLCLDKSMPNLKPKHTKRSTVNKLHAQLTLGRNNLFFVTMENEWHLVSVAYKDTMSVHPNCLQDGKFLVDFSILHPKDHWFST